VLGIVGIIGATAPVRAAASFEVLGRFWPAGVSDDGTTVAGTGNDPAAPGQVMVLWTPAGGLRTAGWSEGHEHTTAHALSGDGSTVLGVDYNANILTWTAAGGVQYPSGTNGSPGGINRDGSVIVGGHVAGGPFRWTAATGAVPLPTPPGWADNGADGRGNAVSADGSVVGGTLFNTAGTRHAFRWAAGDGTVLLEHPAGLIGSDTIAISADGSALVGWAYDATEVHRPFRWTDASGLQLLPVPIGQATDVTADGAIVIGNGQVPDGDSAFIWDATRGARDLKAALAADYGVDLAGWTLLSADAITPDGMTIVGRGAHRDFGDNVAWRVVVPEPAAGLALVVVPALLRRRRRENCNRRQASATLTRPSSPPTLR
jgi:probable HAF family extracellular repeat protein